jgi:AraC-like DNA-binding protein
LARRADIEPDGYCGAEILPGAAMESGDGLLDYAREKGSTVYYGRDTFAEMAGASARTLARLFQRETGMSFQAWRRQLRLTEGLAALSEGETPARVAAAVGYGSGPAFGAAFRSVFGTTPGRSRRGS